MSLIPAPLPEWGPIVAMLEFNGRIYIACSFRVLKLVNGEFRTVMIVGA